MSTNYEAPDARPTASRPAREAPVRQAGTNEARRTRAQTTGTLATGAWSTGAWLLLGLVVWAARVHLPDEPAPPELDPSWQQALGRALVQGLRFGPGLVFPCGPAGALANARYEPELFWVHLLVFEGLFKGYLVVRWIEFLRRRASAPDLVAVVLALLTTQLGPDGYAIATILIVATSHLGDEAPSFTRRALDFVAFAVLAYVKFTFLVLGAFAAALTAVHAARGARARGSPPLAAGSMVLATWIAAMLLVWIAFGQRLSDLVPFVTTSWAHAQGYTEAQARDGSPEDVRLGLVTSALLAVALVTFVWTQRARRGTVLVALAFAAATFVAFRASYTFHSVRAFTFFTFTALGFVVLAPVVETGRVARVVLGSCRAGIVALSLAGLTGGFESSAVEVLVKPGVESVAATARALVDVRGLRAELEASGRRRSAEFDLPRVRAEVGDASIDFVGNVQAWIFLNHLRWQPRPVFQSYCTTTEDLQRLNGAFLAGEAAPEYVLIDAGAIANRAAFLEDTDAWWALLARYAPVLRERGLVLLKRDAAREREAQPSFETVAEIEARPLEVVDLRPFAAMPADSSAPGSAPNGSAGANAATMNRGRPLVRLRFDVRYSWLGRLRRLVYHAPMTAVKFVGDDGEARTRRLVPGMARGGLLVRPVLESSEDWIDAYTSGATKSIDSFLLLSPNDWSTYYEPTYRVVVERSASSWPLLVESRVRAIVFGSFPTVPIRARTPDGARALEDGTRDIVLVGTDAELEFALEPGSRRLTGAFGQLEEARRGDGVDFEFALEGPSDSTASSAPRRVLLARTLDAHSPDLRAAALDVVFEARTGDRLIVRTSNPAGRDVRFDLPYLAAVRIE